jgi:hypothetical protein
MTSYRIAADAAVRDEGNIITGMAAMSLWPAAGAACRGQLTSRNRPRV